MSNNRERNNAFVRRGLRARHAGGPQRGRPGEREIGTRFDFKNTGSSIDLSEKSIELATESDARLKALTQVLEEKLVRRQVSLKALRSARSRKPPRERVRQTVTLNMGISSDKAREIGKFLKGLSLKGVQHQVQGDQLRVTGKKRDDLQAAIQACATTTSTSRCSSRTSATGRTRRRVAEQRRSLLGRAPIPSSACWSPVNSFLMSRLRVGETS